MPSTYLLDGRSAVGGESGRSTAREGDATRAIGIVIAIVAVLVSARSGLALDAACGLTVPDGETAVLQADLTCPSDPIGITLGKSSTLDLNGFTLRVTAPDATGVSCVDRACSVVSSVATPGVISGETTGHYGIAALGTLTDVTRMLIQNVIVRDVTDVGIYGTGTRGRTTMTNVTVSGCGYEGINVIRKLVFTGLVVNGNADGIVVQGLLKGVGLTLNGNTGKGMWHIQRAILTNLTASGNGIIAMQAVSTVLRDSALSGNGQADIVSERLPRLTNTTCERSARNLSSTSPAPWGVCSLD